MFTTKTNKLWRTLIDSSAGSDKWAKLRDALIAVGEDRESAEEYCDDPNAIPTDLQRKLNDYVEKTK